MKVSSFSLVNSAGTYPSHQDDAVNAHLPLLPEHLLRLTPKCAGVTGFLAGLLGFEELFGFREAYANESNTDGGASCKFVSFQLGIFSKKNPGNGPAIQKTVFQLSVEPPTPRFAQAASTYPNE
jgi:hypothetical protein